jgi:sterol desaturase/sphingolipid hydroxylase (fatty acid hydroxylase superfamily)
METLELISLLFLPAFLLLDLVFRAQRFSPTRFWRLRALIVSSLVFLFAGEIAVFWGGVFEGVNLFNASGLGIWGGAAVGVLVYQLLHYAYHRFEHHNDRMWRWSHQFHHSAESLDAFGANYLSPIDTIAFTSFASLVFFPLLGLPVGAGIIGGTFLAFCAVFQHANIRTPRWLGYIIQRPESHALHHGRGVHGSNYADLPLVDMLFGTFANPKEHRAEVGFWDGASARIGDMLMGRDVSEMAGAERALVQAATVEHVDPERTAGHEQPLDEAAAHQQAA